MVCVALDDDILEEYVKAVIVSVKIDICGVGWWSRKRPRCRRQSVL
jgi:hypothetical protein